MTVYVDDARVAYGRMKMCHMMADSTEELIAMAESVGVHRRHLQFASTEREHFDVCLSSRRKAVSLGAIEVSSRHLVEIIRARRRA